MNLLVHIEDMIQKQLSNKSKC